MFFVQVQPNAHLVPNQAQVEREREYSNYLVQWRVEDVKNYMQSDLTSLLMHKCSDSSNNSSTANKED